MKPFKLLRCHIPFCELALGPILIILVIIHHPHHCPHHNHHITIIIGISMLRVATCCIPLCNLALGPSPAKLESQMLIHSNARWHLLECSPTATLAKLDLQMLMHSNPCSGMAYSHKEFLLMCKVVKLFVKIT